jgi:hypothetical protein
MDATTRAVTIRPWRCTFPAFDKACVPRFILGYEALIVVASAEESNHWIWIVYHTDAESRVKAPIIRPINDIQREYNRLCELSGGRGGGPAEIRVKELLRATGRKLNKLAYEEMALYLNTFPDANPWHICFAMGIAWGHLAKLEEGFIEAAIGALVQLNDEDLKHAATFHLERGPDPIEQSLRGGYTLFQRVVLPTALPETLPLLARAQDRWLSPILSKDRPRYIGSWNATAMFMCVLFAQPALAAMHVQPRPVLPPGGPILAGLRLLHRTGVLPTPPDETELDDQAFDPTALYLNNDRLADILTGLEGWSLVDVHSGVYMLGTRHPHSHTWE